MKIMMTMMIRMMMLLLKTSFKFGNSFSLPKFVMMIPHSSQRYLQSFTTIHSYDSIQVTQLTKYQKQACTFNYRYHHGSNFQLFQSKSQSSSTSSSSSHDHSTTKNPLIPFTSTKKQKQKQYPLLPIPEILIQIGVNRTIATKPIPWTELYSIINIYNDPSLLSRSQQVQSNYMGYVKDMKEEWVSMNDCILYTKFGDIVINNDNDDNENDNLFTKIKNNNGKYTIHPSFEEFKKYPKKNGNNEDGDNIVIYKRLLLNDYPYFVESNVQHWCLWKLSSGCNTTTNTTTTSSSSSRVTEEDIKKAIEELKLMAIQEDNERKDTGTINTSNSSSNRHGRLGKVIDTISWINPKHLQSIPDIDHAHILCLRED